MNNRSKKKFPYLWAVIYGILLTGYTVFTLLDTFVIPRDLVYVDKLPPKTAAQTVTPAESSAEASETADTQTFPQTADTEAPHQTSDNPPEAQSTTEATPEPTTEPEPIITDPIITDDSYESSSISIKINTLRVHDTQIYIADVVIKDPNCLRTGLAFGAFGRNLKQYTSTMAQENGAILAINGDYYGFRESGYVMRNGYLYRTNPRSGANCDGMAIFDDGHMEVYKEPEIDAQGLADAGAVQIFCFGPALLKDSEVLVNENSEVELSLNSNPRTAIGQISPLHYLLVVSDGRTDESKGLSLLQLAQLLKEQGCDTAYNLDGGGSTAMWFNGKIVNVPTNGNHLGERGISDIVYIGE